MTPAGVVPTLMAGDPLAASETWADPEVVPLAFEIAVTVMAVAGAVAGA